MYVCMYVCITTVYGYHYVTWRICGRPVGVLFGECSISVIEQLYNYNK